LIIVLFVAPGGTSQATNQLQLNIQKQPTVGQSQQMSHRTKSGHFASGQRFIVRSLEMT